MNIMLNRIVLSFSCSEKKKETFKVVFFSFFKPMHKTVDLKVELIGFWCLKGQWDLITLDLIQQLSQNASIHSYLT